MILDNLAKQEKLRLYDSLILLEVSPLIASLSSFYASGAIESANFFHQSPELLDKILNGTMAATLAGGAVLTAYLTSVAITKGASGTYTGLKKALYN
ncbi:hypothetical protein HQ489_00405 [Candidatus Woesearchaeota archaeon]|nr:hypothetical protein [Candidatus Woesearchaeota archaeon]